MIMRFFARLFWAVKVIVNIKEGLTLIKIKNIPNYFFARYLSNSGDGGVICVSTSSYSMNINYSMFYNCVCSVDGGAIHFYSTNHS